MNHTKGSNSFTSGLSTEDSFDEFFNKFSYKSIPTVHYRITSSINIKQLGIVLACPF